MEDHRAAAGQRERRWAVIIVGTFVGVAVVCCGGVGVMLVAPVLTGEFDGKRDLINGYELWMLKGHPRFIRTPGGKVIPRKDLPPGSRHGVGRYEEIAGRYIVGELLDGGCFVVDTQLGRSAEYDTRQTWEAALRAEGIDPARVKLRW